MKPATPLPKEFLPGTKVEATRKAISNHDVPHYKGQVGTVIEVTPNGYVFVRWNGWSSIWTRDELNIVQYPEGTR